MPAPGFEDYGEPRSHDEPIKVAAPAPGFQGSYGGPTVELENLNWRKMDGPFVSVWLHNVTWGGENTMAAPDAKVLYF